MVVAAALAVSCAISLKLGRSSREIIVS